MFVVVKKNSDSLNMFKRKFNDNFKVCGDVLLAGYDYDIYKDDDLTLVIDYDSEDLKLLKYTIMEGACEYKFCDVVLRLKNKYGNDFLGKLSRYMRFSAVISDGKLSGAVFTEGNVDFKLLYSKVGNMEIFSDSEDLMNYTVSGFNDIIKVNFVPNFGKIENGKVKSLIR